MLLKVDERICMVVIALAAMAVVVLGVKLACFSWVATVIPLLFPRLTILAMQILGMYKPPKNKEGGDEPV